MTPSGIGRLLIAAGLVALVAGVVFLLLGRLGVGRLPGDLQFGRGNFRFYFPLGTSIVLSIVLTVLLNLFLRRR